MKNLPDKPVPCPPIKSLFDKVLAGFLLLLFSPLFLLIFILNKINGLLVSTDKGPVFFFIERITQGKVFWLLKFRIVKTDRIETLRQQDGRIDDINLLEQDKSNLTCLGRILKKYYLDELPQLVNILKGDMSFVGTRPYPIGLYQNDLKQGLLRKKLIKAGLTGPVQAMKGLFTYYAQDIDMDNEYVIKMGTLTPLRLLFYDIRILFESIATIYRAEGL